MKFTWNRNKGYEVSSIGDKRFSAFYAKLKDGRTIEEAYQLDIKGYRIEGNHPLLGKGKPPLIRISKEKLYEEYLSLWLQWAIENITLMLELKEKAKLHNNVLSDIFANTNINQARALSEILTALDEIEL